MDFYLIPGYILHTHLYKFSFNEVICFILLCALTKCIIIGDQTGQIVGMIATTVKLQRLTKNLVVEGINQI